MLKAIGIAFVALFLAAPLASAHSCGSGEVGVDLDHNGLLCVHTPRLVVCAFYPHVCADPIAAAASDEESPSLP